MSPQLSQIAKKAKLDPKTRFTSLAHLLTLEFLQETWGKMNRKAAGGVDGQSAEEFGNELETQIEVICKQLKEGTYQAPPVRRVDIPKGPGKVGTRPLGIPTVADRLLQRAVARILEAVFEADFLDCSHGFRPGRNPHHALQALRVQIVTKKVGQVFEADIRSYFTRINHQWLRKMVAHRIADPVILRLIGKWLNAGAMQDGVVTYAEEGTPQGGSISPVLSNLYLHFVLDLWFEKKIKPQCRGEAYLVRFADDFVVSFQFRQDVDQFQQQVRKRFADFRTGAGRRKDSAHTLWTIRSCDMSATWTGKAGDLRVSGLQTCLWGGSEGAICSDAHPQRQELSEVPGSDTGVDLKAQTLETMGATGTSDEDVARLLSVLWAASL